MKLILSAFVFPMLLFAAGCFDVTDASLPNERMSDAEKLATCERKMSVRFPAETRLAHLKAEAGLDSKIELIVELDRAGWEHFKKNSIFRIQELKIRDAGNRKFGDWDALERGESATQSYRPTDGALRILAERSGGGGERERIFVYSFWHEL